MGLWQQYSVPFVMRTRTIMLAHPATVMDYQQGISASSHGGLFSEEEDLRDSGNFSGSHEHQCLLRFCFSRVLQKDLDECKDLWNTQDPAKQTCIMSWGDSK